MNTIDHLVSVLDKSDARSTLYYLSRYLKQAAHLDASGKDIFIDDERSAPTESVILNTLSIIEFIEMAEGVPAAEFDNEAYARWADHVADVERSLQSAISEDVMARAKEFIETTVVPTNKPLRSSSP
jgi:hypothetical protein